MPNLFIIQFQKILLTSFSKQIRIPNQANNILVISTFLVSLRTECSCGIRLVQALSLLHLSASFKPPQLLSIRKVMVKCASNKPLN